MPGLRTWGSNVQRIQLVRYLLGVWRSFPVTHARRGFLMFALGMFLAPFMVLAVCALVALAWVTLFPYDHLADERQERAERAVLLYLVHVYRWAPTAAWATVPRYVPLPRLAPRVLCGRGPELCKGAYTSTIVRV